MDYYIKDDITFENEFLNGHKTGENDDYSYLLFEGEYANNFREKG